MDSKRKLIQVFNNNPQGRRLSGRPKNKWWNCVQTVINKCKITNWNERSLTLLFWNGLYVIKEPMQRQRSFLLHPSRAVTRISPSFTFRNSWFWGPSVFTCWVWFWHTP